MPPKNTAPPELDALARELGIDPTQQAAGDDPFVGALDLDVMLRRGGPRSVGRALGDTGYGSGETKKQSQLLRELFAETDPAVVVDIQEKLYQAGFYGEVPRTAIRWGTVDERTAKAYETALTRAGLFNRAGRDVTLDEMLSQGAGATGPGAEGKIIGGRVGGGNVYPVTLSDPDTLRATADKVAQAVLGRTATDEERARVVAALQSEEQAAATTVNTAREGQDRAQFEAALGAERSQALVATSGGIVSPVPGQDAPADTLGADRDGGKRRHKGTDIFGPEGSQAVAPIGGKVVRRSSGGKGGNAVWIEGDDGRFHYLAHFAAVSVKTGDRVEQGQPIGTVGRTGNATGTDAHVHYSINSKVGSEDAVGNPALELRGAAGKGGAQGAIQTVPSTYIPPVTTTTREVDPAASAERMLREQNPAEAQAHDLAGQFTTFLDLLRSPV